MFAFARWSLPFCLSLCGCYSFAYLGVIATLLLIFVRVRAHLCVLAFIAKKGDKQSFSTALVSHPCFFLVVDKKHDKKFLSGTAAKTFLNFALFAP